MKVKELIEELEMLNPEKTVYGTMVGKEFNQFQIKELSIATGYIVITLNNIPDYISQLKKRDSR